MWVGRPTSSQAVLLPRRPRIRDVAWATALQATWGPSQRLREQSAVMTIEAATMQWPCDGLFEWCFVLNCMIVSLCYLM